MCSPVQDQHWLVAHYPSQLIPRNESPRASARAHCSGHMWLSRLQVRGSMVYPPERFRNKTFRNTFRNHCGNSFSPLLCDYFFKKKNFRKPRSPKKRHSLRKRGRTKNYVLLRSSSPTRFPCPPPVTNLFRHMFRSVYKNPACNLPSRQYEGSVMPLRLYAYLYLGSLHDLIQQQSYALP
jgi:hypothetical protein